MGKRRSLEKKFMIYLTCLITLIMLLVTVVYVYLEREQARQLIGEQALTTALAVSEIPDVKTALENGSHITDVQQMVGRIRESSGAEYIVIGDTAGVRITHPDPTEIGQQMVGGDNEGALVYGDSYISLADGSLGTSVRGKTPVINEAGEIIGVVSVGFMIEYINSIFQQGFIAFVIWLSLIFLLGLLGSRVLARSIRNDTFGLEPYQIARLYKERHAIFESVKEGLIATDQNGIVTLVNQSAKEMLQLDENGVGKPVDVVLPKSEMAEVLKHQTRTGPHEAIFRDRRLIIHYQTIEEGGAYGGKVASFQNRSELNELIHALSEMQQYSQDLRAQTHEYTNKLYAISGWLQLGYTQKAMDFIHQETGTQNRDSKIMFEQIKDPTIQAVLAGKRSKASEKKIEFIVEPESSVNFVWPHAATGPIVTILGNVIDNAFEAVLSMNDPKVDLFMTDMADELIIEVADNGAGIDETIADRVFEQGVSTKPDGQGGYGLALVQAALRELEGSLEMGTNQPQGTIVSLYIPKDAGGSRR